MDDEKIQILGNKKYKAIEFKPKKEGDIACNHCAFELGKCRSAIIALGQCYIVEDGIEIRNVYYEEVKEEKLNKK